MLWGANKGLSGGAQLGMKIEHPLLEFFLRCIAIDFDTLLKVTIVARLSLSYFLLINVLLSSFFASSTFLC